MSVCDMNYPAVFLAALLFFCLGALWYSPTMFLDRWMKSLNLDPNTKNGENGEKHQKFSLILMFLAALVFSATSACITNTMIHIHSDLNPLCVAMCTAFGLWIGTIASYLISQVAFEGRTWTYFWINSGYWLCGLLINGVIHSLWR